MQLRARGEKGQTGMKLHDLAPAAGQHRARRRVGRGNAGRAGTYAGRGRKGQNARSGGSKAPYFEGGQLPFVRRLPFKRGFHNAFRVEYVAVNLSQLNDRFDPGTEVTPEVLRAEGIIGRIAGGYEPYKVLARGELGHALTVHAPRFSQAARAAIEAAGGSCVDLEDNHSVPGMRREHKRFR